MHQEFLPFDLIQRHPEQDWLVEGLLPLGYTAILASEPKAGKTCLATAIALAVGTGQDFAGLRTLPGNVLWFALEESASERSTVLHHYSTDGESPAIHTSFEPLRIDEEDTYVYLQNVCLDFEPKLIVIDPLYAAIGGYSLGEANRARRSLTYFKQFCSALKVTGLVLHHLTQHGLRYNRHPRVAESAQLAATASMQILLTHYPLHPTTQNSHPTTPNLENPNRRESPVPLAKTKRIVHLDVKGRGDVNRKWRFISDGPLDYREGDPDLAPPRESEKVQAIRHAISIGHQRAIDIIYHTNLRPSTVRNLLASMLANGEVTVERIVDRNRYYALT